MYVSHRSQARREQRFGESLRDQLNRRIAQLDDRAATARVTLINVLLGGICPTALILAGWRINNEPVSDQWVGIVGGIVLCAMASVAGVWAQRRSMERDFLPRRRRLETLLKDLDAP